MFKQALGSPRLASNEEQQELSILSPRNFLKMIADSIGDFTRNNLSTPNQHNYQAFVTTFDPYLSTFQEEYKKYTKSKCKKQKPNKHEQLQLQLKINRIPAIFFTQCQHYQLQLSRRGEGRKKQEEMTEYLDEIELALFSKAGKYPQKSTIIIDNMISLDVEADRSLQKVLAFRQHLKEKIVTSSKQQLKIKKISQKIERIKTLIDYAQTIKKMKNLKDCSSSVYDDNQSHEQILLKVKKTDLQRCSNFTSLEKIIKNLEGYRTQMKQKLYKQFLYEIQYIINTLLKYNKEDWKDINVPDSIFQGQMEQDVSHNNITILDQSYFAFESQHVNIVSHKNQAQSSPIKEEDQDQNHEILDLTKICKLWTLIKQFDLYDEQEVDEHFTKIMVKHNVAFNHDMQEYITYLQCNQSKEQKQSTNILKGGPQTYASLKGKLSQKEQKPRQISSQTKIQLTEQKIAAVDMKLYIKIVKFQYSLIKKVLSFLNDYRQLQFLMNFKIKLAQFLQGIVAFFIKTKQVTHDLSVQDFLVYLDIIHFWQNQEFYQVIGFCQNLKNSKIEEYLTNVQKMLLIKQLKTTIEGSTYLPISVSSNHYMTFHSLLSPNSTPHFDDDINMSVTFQLDQLKNEQEQADVTLRIINKSIIYKDKAYMICDSFLELIKNVERYKKLKDNLDNFQQNIEEKICELIGFYAWYNQKNLINSKAGAKTLKNYCTFFSTLLLLKEILENLSITNKKVQKTKVQLNECETQISKTITMTPFMTIQYQISQLYQAKITPKTPVPTPPSQRIIEVLKISFDCLKEYFPLEYEQKLHQSLIVKFMQTTVKLISKNYVGFLANMQKRGLAEIRWFLPKFREVTEITIVRDNNLVNKKGESLLKNGNTTFCIFHDEAEEMEKTLRLKSMEK